MAIKTAIYHRHPRGFANECEMVRVDIGDRLLRSYLVQADYQRLTLAAARRHVRHVNGEWGSGRAFRHMSLSKLPISGPADIMPRCWVCGDLVTDLLQGDQHKVCR